MSLSDAKRQLIQARSYAQSARFPEMLGTCRQIVASQVDEPTVLLEVGELLSGFGFLSEARQCYERVARQAQNDPRALVNLANLARDSGDHAGSHRLYQSLLAHLPNNAVIWRNVLTSLEYDPGVTDAERLRRAFAWGRWAEHTAGAGRARPLLAPVDARALRVGYVSADLCQHTVGLFLKDVLKAHDAEQVTVFAYSAGSVQDWVTNEIRRVCQLREVASLSDAALADLICQDAIDVLVDLSGHTAGSRLTVFARRPAPVQVSWLGYFASTGLACIDAVLLDPWHAPPGTEALFVEPIIRLPQGRLCYQPVPWMPAAVPPPPSLARGYITFGSFNNTSKYNDGVFDLWARILAGVTDSRLVLKWRTFNDEALRQSVTAAFVQRGIDADRIELRGPSFHGDLLKEYADIDIALDPFPFSGAMTSCEALWMGVPVVTWPQTRVVSRQTFALLSAIGVPDLAAGGATDYVRIAVELARNHERLTDLRSGLRRRMQASPLMDVAGFARHLEQSLLRLYKDINDQAWPQ